jgi:hypothetical protein
MYEIELIDGQIMWMNERIIMEIHRCDDGTFVITHFNEKTIKIKNFKKLN